jgi:hypothetical protein
VGGGAADAADAMKASEAAVTVAKARNLLM